jgi:NAD(P)-dependent dehydrogenase (short-subunit alcohol dehydrogenase family)
LDVNPIGAEATARRIHVDRGQARSYRCDVSDAADVDRVVGRVVDELGPPAVCCNVAGIGKFARSEEEPVEEFEHIVRVNLVGTFAVSRACLPHLLATGGCIVNVSSSAGLFGQPYNAAYCASKGGVTLMTRAMAVEFNRRGVRVNAVAPAGIDTPLTKDFAFVDGTDLHEYQKLFPPTGKMGDPESVATLIAFLASDDADYISGAVVPIDMGVTA